MEEDKLAKITKGVVMLNALKAKRRLHNICSTFNISYKFCHAVTQGLKPPTWDLMNKLLFIIPAQFWFEEADNDFIQQVQENIKR